MGALSFVVGGGGWLIGGVRGEEGKEGGMVFLSFAPDFC